MSISEISAEIHQLHHRPEDRDRPAGSSTGCPSRQPSIEVEDEDQDQHGQGRETLADDPHRQFLRHLPSARRKEFIPSPPAE